MEKCPRRTDGGIGGSLMATPVVPNPEWIRATQGVAPPKSSEAGLCWDEGDALAFFKKHPLFLKGNYDVQLR